MCHSDHPTGGSPPGAARPARPLPDLCPTSRAAPLCAVPDLPDLFLARVYMQSRWTPFHHSYTCAYRSGRSGRSGKLSHGAGFDCPTSPHAGRAGHERSGRARRWAHDCPWLAHGLPRPHPGMRGGWAGCGGAGQMLRKAERRSGFVQECELLRKYERRSVFLNKNLTKHSGSSPSRPSAGSTAAIHRKFQAVNFGLAGRLGVQSSGLVGGSVCRN